ncbi:MAG TPA: aconitase X catalytic domain-containing protein [Vicinamibacterales bacterium]|nr:aconitase X catalytic domain-containing protein [Vicinamibacterales bacterium]
MNLTDSERRMLDGAHGKARQKAMELLVRYAEALGAERFVDTRNVAGVPGSANPFLQNYYQDKSADGRDAIFSFFDLDADELIDVPDAVVPTYHLQGGADPTAWQTLGVKVEVFRNYEEREKFAAQHDVGILKTCTPYLAGNVPTKGEHLAWMESSAVIYANSVLGARTNTEGRESTSAAMLTGKIPDWGLHRTEHRYGTHRIDVEIPIASVMDWGMLGYFVGDVVQERIPVLRGDFQRPDIVRLKHFGAAASSSGGVEMYHIVGVTPEAETLEMAFGPRQPVETFAYSTAVRRRIYDRLNANASDPNVDYVMLGCPHAALEQLQEAARLLDGKKVSANCQLWIFTSRAVKSQASETGIIRTLSDAGAVLLTDTCSAFAQALPPGTKVAALDSAKQAHYLPAILGVQAWFGSTADCINAALTGRWNPEEI